MAADVGLDGGAAPEPAPEVVTLGPGEVAITATRVYGRHQRVEVVAGVEFLTLKDAAGRKAYLPHPAHKAFGKLLGPHLDKVLVID